MGEVIRIFRQGDIAYPDIQFVVKINDEDFSIGCDLCGSSIRPGDLFGWPKNEMNTSSDLFQICIKCLVKP